MIQNFSVAKDLLGITRIGDLSSPDMDKIRCIALIELTATFDYHSILVRVPRVPKLKVVKGISDFITKHLCLLFTMVIRLK